MDGGRNAEAGEGGFPMKRLDRLALVGAAILFLIFFSNVSLGAFGGKPVLNDVQEMLTLVAAAVLFSVGVLQIEARSSQE